MVDKNSPITLDYSRAVPRRFLRNSIVWIALFFAMLCVASAVYVTDLLHNKPIRPVIVVWSFFAAMSFALLLVQRSTAERERETKGRWIARLCWVVLSIGILFGGLSIVTAYTMPDPHQTARNLNYCTRHLESLFYVLQSYAEENHGAYPPSLATVVQSELKKGEPIDEFTCPAAQPLGYASSPTTQAIVSELSPRGSPTYIYLGSGLNQNCPPASVLVYDAPSNHLTLERGGKGIHVLYADGRIEWLEGNARQKFLAEISAGHNPPKMQ